MLYLIECYSHQEKSVDKDWQVGWGSAVGIATGYGLDGPGIKFRWGSEIFQTGPGAHPASYMMGKGKGKGAPITGHEGPEGE